MTAPALPRTVPAGTAVRCVNAHRQPALTVGAVSVVRACRAGTLLLQGVDGGPFARDRFTLAQEARS